MRTLVAKCRLELPNRSDCGGGDDGCLAELQAADGLDATRSYGTREGLQLRGLRPAIGIECVSLVVPRDAGHAALIDNLAFGAEVADRSIIWAHSEHWDKHRPIAQLDVQRCVGRVEQEVVQRRRHFELLVEQSTVLQRAWPVRHLIHAVLRTPGARAIHVHEIAVLDSTTNRCGESTCRCKLPRTGDGFHEDGAGWGGDCLPGLSVDAVPLLAALVAMSCS